jgi:hypothetical protein
VNELAATLKWHEFCPVKEKLRMRDHNDPLRNVPALVNTPPPRCFYRDGNDARTICGELAVRVRPGREWFDTAYFCEAHHQPGDLEIPAVHPIRR